MSERTNREKPEVYALRQDGGTWQISRRDFLKTAGIGAAALGAGLNSRLVRPAEAEDLSKLCKETSAHPDEIKKLMVSPDGKYLVSYSNGMVKCWDFDNYSLLGLRKVSVSDHYGNFLTVGMYRGKQCLLFKLSNENRIDAVELPAMEKHVDNGIKIDWIGSNKLLRLECDRRGNLYILRLDQTSAGNQKYIITRVDAGSGSDRYKNTADLFESEEEINSYAVFDNGKKLFLVSGGHNCRIADLSDNSTADVSEMPAIKTTDGFSILPGETAVLYPEWSPSLSLDLVSLTDGKTVWANSLTETKYNKPEVMSCAVTPDGSFGVLLGREAVQILWLISIKDGKVLKETETGSFSDDCTRIAIANDGRKAAIANGKSILFFSLPDLEVIGCPMEIEYTKDNAKGITFESTDAVTGKTVTVTLPCGAAIPAGAVCTCNCVAGSVPSCTCVGHTCSCNSHRSGGGGGHYWHPN